jgi:hypothetical protein
MPRPTGLNRNAEIDFRGEKRSNATHVTKIEPEARLSKKFPSKGAALCFLGHALMNEAGSAKVRRNPPQGSELIVCDPTTVANGWTRLKPFQGR